MSTSTLLICRSQHKDTGKRRLGDGSRLPTSSSLRCLAFFLCVSVSLCLRASVFAAAPSEPQYKTGDDVLQLDPFEVTGSLIRRAEVEGPAPVKTISREEIEQIGLAAFSEFMASLPEAGYTSLNEAYTISPDAGASALRGASTLSLRLAGSANTLVLVDGRRAVLTGASAGGSAFVDQNRFPAAMVERVEILQDCGAIYGSGAAAGVVNIILRKNYNGAEVTARYGNSFRTDVGEKSLSVFVGASNQKSSLTVGLTYFDRGAIRASDTTFSNNADLTDRFAAKGPDYAARIAAGESFDLRNTIGPQARILPVSGQRNGVNGVNIPVSVYPANTLFSFLPGTGNGTTIRYTQATPSFTAPATNGSGGQYSAVAAGTFVFPIYTAHSNPSNLYNTRELTWLTPSTQRTGINASFRHTLSPQLNVYARVAVQRNRMHIEYEPVPISYTSDNNIFVPKTNYWNPFGIDVWFVCRPVDFGPRKADAVNETLATLVGAQGTIASRWSWDAGYSYGFDQNIDTTSNQISESRLRARLAKSTPDAFNVFGGADFKNDPATLDSFRVSTKRRGTSMLHLWDARISGDAVTLPTGTVRAGFLAEVRRDKYSEINDALSSTLNDIIGQNATSAPMFARRTVQAVVGEVQVPLAKRGEHALLYNSDLAMAARFENFSDGFNSGIKPYFGWRIQPVPRLTLRASLARTFRAPMLPMLYGGLRESTPTALPDLRRPQALTGDVFDGTSQPRTVRQEGNPHLRPTDSRAHQFGLVYDVPGELFKGLTVGATYYALDEENFPTRPGTLFIRNNEVGGGTAEFVVRDPGSETYTNTTAGPINILSGPNGAMTTVARLQTVTVPGRIRYISDTYVEAYHTHIRGWDYSVKYTRNVGRYGRIDLRSTAAYCQYFGQGLVSQPLLNAAGVNSFVPRTRLQSSLTWMRTPWSAVIAHSYIRRSGEFVDLSAVDSYSLVNASVSRSFTGDGKKWLSGTRITLGVDNAFDREPPLYYSSSGYIAGFARRPAGRFFYAEVKKSY